MPHDVAIPALARIERCALLPRNGVEEQG